MFSIVWQQKVWESVVVLLKNGLVWGFFLSPFLFFAYEKGD